MILVTFAVPFESAEFRRRAVSRRVRIVHTGVGSEAAQAAIEAAICAEMPDLVISSGFAGALTADFCPGDVVTAGECVEGKPARFVSADRVLSTSADKRAFRSIADAEVVDMESDAIRSVCATAGVPMRILRVISDGADDELGLPPDLLGALADRPLLAVPRLLGALAGSPIRRKQFVAFVRNCRRAQRSLADALEREIRLLLR